MPDSRNWAGRRFAYNPTIAMIVAMVAGAIAGIAIGQPMGEIKFIGDIFFRLIQMGMVAFVMCQIIEAVGGLTRRQLSGMGSKAVTAFLVSSLLASAFGVLAAVVFRPGAGLAGTELVREATTDLTATTLSIQDTITGFFTSNVFASMGSGSMVPCIVFSVFFGLGISMYQEKHGGSCVIYCAVLEINEVLLSIIRMVMNIAPVGIFCYVSASIGTLGIEVLVPIGKYIVVLAAATLVFTVGWLIFVSAKCGLSLPRLVRKMVPMSVMAAATISSAVTLPLEMEDAKHKIGIRADVANLVLPLGVPLNSNGSALHMALTAVFVSQMYNMDFVGAELMMVVVIAWLLSLANAVAPGATLISLTMLMPALGLPLDAVAILGGLEYIVAAIRTTLNVNSDVFCALLVASSEGAIDREVFNS